MHFRNMGSVVKYDAVTSLSPSLDAETLKGMFELKVIFIQEPSYDQCNPILSKFRHFGCHF